MTTADGQRLALVTGASKGIGRAIAERLARDGLAVAVAYRTDPDGADAAAASIRDAGGTADTVAVDLTDPGGPDQMVKSVGKTMGAIDVLVNNAGIFPWRHWTEISIEEWDRVMAVDLRAPFFLARACHTAMQRSGWGRIVMISSATALTGDVHLTHYASAKAGLLGLTRSLARALGDDGITVNAVTTGKTLTEGFRRWFDDGTLDYDETIRSRQAQPIKRTAEPADVAGAVSFLASDDAAFMTGQLLNIDGGRIMR